MAEYEVDLLDADYDNLKTPQIAALVVAKLPNILMLGHSGSTFAQPVINEITQLYKYNKNNVTRKYTILIINIITLALVALGILRYLSHSD